MDPNKRMLPLCISLKTYKVTSQEFREIFEKTGMILNSMDFTMTQDLIFK